MSATPSLTAYVAALDRVAVGSTALADQLRNVDPCETPTVPFLERIVELTKELQAASDAAGRYSKQFQRWLAKRVR